MKTVGIDLALTDPNLLGVGLGDPSSWRTWFAVLKASFGVALNQEERRAFMAVAGDRNPPDRRVRELFAICGRRGGKSRMAAAIAVYIAACIDHSRRLAVGEPGMVLVLAATRAQAKVCFDYVAGFLQSSSLLAEHIEAVTSNEVRLKDNIVIAVHSNSFRSVRGRTLIAAVFDEVSFWRDETTANPDIETYRAVLPSLARTEGMLIAISSPYRRAGLMYAKHRDYFGKDGDDTLIVQGGTFIFNPSIDAGVIARARESDPLAALSEWDAEFRTDLSAFLDDASIDAAIDHGRPLELPRRENVAYRAFTDASAGRHDAFTVCIAHRDGERVIADVVRGKKPPFDPASVAKEYAGLAREYGCSSTGDNYAPGWVAGARALRRARDGGCQGEGHNPIVRSMRPRSKDRSRFGRHARQSSFGRSGGDHGVRSIVRSIDGLAVGSVEQRGRRHRPWRWRRAGASRALMGILDISVTARKQRQARLDGERENYDGELLEKVKRRLRDRARQFRRRRLPARLA